MEPILAPIKKGWFFLFLTVIFSFKIVCQECSGLPPSWAAVTLFKRSPEGVHEWPAYAYAHAARPEAMRSAVKQTALTSGRGGDGERRLIAGLLWPCRSSLLRKSFQGDVLFSLVLQTTLLFKQHRGGKKKRKEKHISSILSLSWCVRAGWGGGGRTRLRGHLCLRRGGEAGGKQQSEWKTRQSALSGY